MPFLVSGHLLLLKACAIPPEPCPGQSIVLFDINTGPASTANALFLGFHALLLHDSSILPDMAASFRSTPPTICYLV